MKATQIYRTDESHPVQAVKALLSGLLSGNHVDAVFGLARTPYSKLPMPALVTAADAIDSLDPLAPVAPFNAARQAASVLKYAIGKRIALVVRPCEERALVELVKLNQCTLENTVIVGMTCLGRMENKAYLKACEAEGDLTASFYTNDRLKDQVTATCRSCDRFSPIHADIVIDLLEMDGGRIGFLPESETGETILSALGLKKEKRTGLSEKKMEEITAKRQEEKKRLLEKTKALISPMENFQKTVAACLNCYNCRTACPVCYCRECVFLTDIFAHKPELLFERATRQGSIKLPQDTSMFHLTRLAHMAHACVGCGHCSSVCPSDIPVADIFRAVSETVQTLYSYEPGKNMDEKPPYIAYREGNPSLEEEKNH